MELDLLKPGKETDRLVAEEVYGLGPVSSCEPFSTTIEHGMDALLFATAGASTTWQIDKFNGYGPAYMVQIFAPDIEVPVVANSRYREPDPADPEKLCSLDALPLALCRAALALMRARNQKPEEKKG
jgi:hypothetical protein